MFIQHIQAPVRKAPEEEETCNQDKGDHESLKYEFFLIAV
jgi:hypothetical protein